MLHHALRASVGAASATTASIVQVTNSSVSVSFSSGVATFTSVDIGTAATGRLVVVYIGGGSSASGSVSSVTIAGNTATLAVKSATSEVRHNSIWYATVDSGTTATIVVNFSVSVSNPVYISVAAIYDASSTTPVTASSQSSSVNVSPNQSVTLTPQTNAVLYAGYSAGAVATGTTASWTGATIALEYVAGVALITAATDSGLSNTSRTVSATLTDSVVNRPGLVVATWA
jgi:hypothetical protein